MSDLDVLEEIMNTDWVVGFHDHGMGRGDFAVIVKKEDNLAEGDDIVVKCPSREVAEHIVAAHKLAQAHVEFDWCEALNKMYGEDKANDHDSPTNRRAAIEAARKTGA